MKNFIILIYFLTFPILIFSQNYFQINIGSDTSSVVLNKSIETADNKYILGGAKYLLSDSIGKAYLIKLSGTGEIINEKEIHKEDSLMHIIDLLKIENNRFLACTYIYKDDTVSIIKNILFTEYDYDFNVLNEFRMKFPTDSLYVNVEMDIRKIDNELLCFGKCRSVENYKAYYYIYKVTTEGDSLNFQLFGEDIYDLEIVEGNKILMTGMGYDEFYMTISKLDYHTFSRDSTFDVSNIPGIPNMGILLLEKTYLEFLTDSTFVFSGIDLQPQMNVTVLDTSFNVLHNTSFGFDYQEFPAKREGLSVLNENEMFIANWDLFLGFGLTKLDSELNIFWEKFFSVENVFGLNCITATSDGGCLLHGIKSNNQAQTVIIKTDNNGNIASIDDELSNVKAHELILYPNPGNEQLIVRTAVQCLGGEFKLYDINGKLVLSQTIVQSTTEINTQYLPSSTYIYNYIYKGKEIESGKWVKSVL